MRFNLDAHLGVHQQALVVGAKRTEIIANNLANADTPGFKARDVDFRAALAQAGGSAGQNGAQLGLVQTSGGHLTTEGTSSTVLGGSLKYRTPLAPSLDGNTVEAQVEQAAFAENAVRYQATLSFLNSKFRGLMTALTGQ